ncbi:ABC transporter ATP-binding protein [Methylobacterium symbioticum]|uniref:Lipopolysaccharide export system ATP-binding protein LptB n=1 Tax=Methylobacterium symbioticum TaxID=2584084 RepID=A0A509ECZ3_9HYPH|nr:ABC transporter ATP-binding protein [Methylobacterium symbioticum]VUD72137.1 Lipopolysaccharide export system ATP-binding protein LptB [Methylobacterium symbioticum]
MTAASPTHAPASAGAFEPALAAEGLGVRYGSFVALKDVTLRVRANSVHAIIGPNGAGKTTLFHALTGRIRTAGGRITLGGRDITRTRDDDRVRLGLARSFQVTSLFATLSVRENLRLAAQGRTPWAALAPWRRVPEHDAAQDTVRALLQRLDLGPVAGRAAGELSHGQQRRLEVGMAMAARPKVILLDEPTSGMGTDDIGAMTDLIRDLGRDHTVLFIEHNMGIVMNISDTVTVMRAGQVLVEGRPAAVRDDPEVRRAYLGNMITGDLR